MVGQVRGIEESIAVFLMFHGNGCCRYFIRGIRRGIEQGDYVYRRGDLLFGPGDPPADIRIDEQAVVMTMAYAKNKGVWPRQKPKPEPPVPGPTPPPEPDPPTPPGSGPTPPGPGPGPTPPGPRPGPTPPGPGPGPTPPGPRPGPAPTVFSAEGVLKDALAQLWEQARAKQAAAIGTLIIRTTSGYVAAGCSRCERRPTKCARRQRRRPPGCGPIRPIGWCEPAPTARPAGGASAASRRRQRSPDRWPRSWTWTRRRCARPTTPR